MVTPQLKAMLESRAKADGRSKKDRAANQRGVAAILEMIDSAAPFMDEGCPPNRWPPSAKLKIAYFVGATAPFDGGQKRALEFIEGMMERSRRLWVAGFVPDPFLDDGALVRRKREDA